MTKFKFGWKPDIPDHRDHYFSAVVAPASIPPFVDLRPNFSPVFHQFELGSCTANAIAAAIEFNQGKQGIKVFVPSRLFIYYNERVLEGTVAEDSGASLRTGVKAVNKWGAPPEKDWPYIVAKYSVKPPSKVYKTGEKHQVLAYQRINQDLMSQQSCLAGGFGFVFGYSVYESFMSDTVAKTGIMPMPSMSEVNYGGHAVISAGYNATNEYIQDVPPRTFIVRNSWGPKWGVNGYFFMPFEYITNNDLSDDFWKITLVEG